jgi:hypothetical protein
MTSTTSSTSRRSDAAVANTVASLLGTAAFAVSFTHVRTVAAVHGQTGAVSYLVAVSVELLAVAAVTEVRQRARRGERYAWPLCVLLLGVAMTGAANLATATPGVWGHVMAVWPAVAFLAVAGMVESRPARTHTEPVDDTVTTVDPQPEINELRDEVNADDVDEPETAAPRPSADEAYAVIVSGWRNGTSAAQVARDVQRDRSYVSRQYKRLDESQGVNMVVNSSPVTA